MKLLLLNRVEIIVANGEIAHYEQFLYLSQCFQKSCVAEAFHKPFPTNNQFAADDFEKCQGKIWP